jgi:hypothetical protein
MLPEFARLEGAVAPPASPFTLAWDAGQGGSIAGYALYYGVTGSTTNRQDLGMVNAVTLFNLLAYSNYFFYLTAYNAEGIESASSSVLYFKPQALSALVLTSPVRGTMNLHFRAAPGSVCQVQFTPSLNPPQWQTLGSATADANGNITISDQGAGNASSRFYRAVIL